MDPFCIWESHLKARFGLHKDLIRKLRQEKLVLGKHWAMRKNRVAYTEEGSRLLQNALQPINGAAVAPVTVEAERVQEGSVWQRPAMELKVWRKVTNLKIIMATDGTNLFRVRVKSAENFVIGMPIQCAHVAADLFELVGNCPRARGRW
jgi:hypothetical protein